MSAAHRLRVFRIQVVWRWTPLVLALVVVALYLAGHRFGNEATEPQGNPRRGREIFTKLPCASCHDVTTPWPGGDVAPNLGNIATEAARIVRLPEYRGNAKDASGYIRESIVAPNAYIVPGPSYRMADGQSVMPKDFATTLTPAALDDLIAFLMTLR